jgi:hypothetical protein
MVSASSSQPTFHIEDLTRAYRVASGHPYVLPTYERLPPTLVYTAPANLLVEGSKRAVVRNGEWARPALMMLAHSNLPDATLEKTIEGVSPTGFPTQ